MAMDDRAEGYVTDVPYMSGYFAGLNPVHMQFAFLAAGLRAPKVETACELGCGNGVSLAIHAAASQVAWYANDLNPDHLRFAREMLAASGANACLYGDSFADFAKRRDLPAFDFIGLHGVWSWVSDRNRETIVSFVAERLKPGGVVYVGYNALPGWSAMQPLRHLMVQHAAWAGSGQPLVQRIDSALEFAGTLLTTSEYEALHPKLAEYFAGERSSDRRYLAHEYFNRDWRPMHFAEVAEALNRAGLTYACSARFLDDVPGLALTSKQSALVDGIADPVLRQSAYDFLVNRQFRRDYWVHGAAPLADRERDEALRQLHAVLCSVDTGLPWKVRAALALNGRGGEEAAIEAALAALSEGRARPLSEIRATFARRGIAADRLLPTLLLLTGLNIVAATHGQGLTSSVAERCARLNRHLADETSLAGDVAHLASPVTGGGIRVDRIDRQFIAAHRAGGSAGEWAARARDVLNGLNGKGSYTAEQIEARMGSLDAHLRLLAALQLVP